MASWPNLEAVAVSHLRTVTGYRTSTRIPSDLAESVPLIRVMRGPGSDDRITDSALLDVESFTARDGSAVDMWDLAEAVREAMHALTGNAVNGVLIDRVTTATGPTYLDYGNPAVSRVVSSYRFEARKRF